VTNDDDGDDDEDDDEDDDDDDENLTSFTELLGVSFLNRLRLKYLLVL